MPKLDIERSVLIEAPISEVYALVSHFNRWPDWSPWLSAERDAKIAFSDDGRSYGWDGTYVGSGRITRLDQVENASLNMRLSIVKPWKSESDVTFTFEKAYDSTRVTWRMDGSLPFFLFFMRSMMETLIGMDYERGLGMLKDLAEIGAVPSRIELIENQSFEGCTYLAITRNCSMAEMPDSMGADFRTLQKWFLDNNVTPKGLPFSIYSKWELGKGMVEYSACFPVADRPSSLPSSFVCSEIPPLDAYVVRHIGAYRHLGNAWSAGMMRQRAKLFKQNKKVYPFEVYVTEIDSVPDEQVVTEVYFPRR